MLIQKAVHNIIMLVAVSIIPVIGSAQCSFVFDLDIPDNSSQTIDIDVSGLVNADLSAGQSVCGINLEFTHNYIGDLTIELVSPEGQSIKLIGEITDMINPTNLANWNVSFIPCTDMAMPDAGFQSTWNNEQAWEVFGNYTGSYYPHSGCFSDFNSGSANGTWQLIINDNSAPATGIFVSAEIVFCDMSGLSCSVCPADAGDFVQSGIDVCEGDPIPPNSFNIEYPSGAPDPDTANATYLVSNGSQPMLITDDPGGLSWTAGMYTVCALSYLKTDSAALFDIIDTMSIDEVRDAFENGAIDLCADLTDQCLDINIRGLPDTTMLNETICNGQAYTIAGQVFDQPGMYNIPLTTLSGCDSIVRLELSVLDVRARIVQSDTLTCDMTTVTLSAASSTVPGTAVFQWESVAGGIVGPTNTPSIQITAPGIYSVTVTGLPSGCQDIRSWDVITDGSQPVIFIDDRVIDCSNPTVTLDPLVFPEDVTYSWNGPGGFTSEMRNPSVSEGGEYWLVATDPDGCSATQSVFVDVDTVAEEARILTIKRCETSFLRLVRRPLTDEFFWTGPNGLLSFNSFLNIEEAGEYTLWATFENGCTDSASVFVPLDFAIPDLTIDATLDSLGCGESSVLTVQSDLPVESFDWHSPFFSITDTSSIEVVAPGEYTVEGEASNGCIGRDTIQILATVDLPTVDVFADTLNCLKDTAVIGVVSGASIINYEWFGPEVVDSFSGFIRVTAPGLYRVEMTDIAGCQLYSAVEVAADFRPPRAIKVLDTLRCNNNPATLAIVPVDPYTDIEWVQNGSVLSTDTFLVVDHPGPFTARLTGVNGCISTRNYDLAFDTIPPEIYIAPASYGCYDSIQLELTPIDSVVSYQWSGMSGLDTDAEDPYVYGPGIYNVAATGLNGCTAERSIDVVPSTETPLFDVATELLDCIDSVALFTASSMDTAATYAWYNSSNVLIEDTSTVVLSIPDIYTLVVTGFNNCVSFDTLELAPPVTPAVFASEDTLNCRDDEVTLFARSDSTMMTYAWFDFEGAPLGVGNELRVSLPGQYTLIGTWSNGCASDTMVRVYIDTLRPTAVALTDEIVRCDTREIYLSGVASLGDSLAFAWDALAGTVLLGDNRDSAFVQGPGTFTLTVEDQVNHCTDRDTLEVPEQPSTLDFLELTIVPECQGNEAGAIIFDSVHIADSPLEYSIGLNGGSTSPVFDSLVKGEYRLSVIDSFGCRLDTVVSVTETSSGTTADLGPDQEILVGGMARLEAVLDVDSSMLGEIFWEPAVSCDSCLTNSVMPLATTDYTIYVRDPFGCLAIDEVRVIVVERGQVYVPNVFTPNGDGNNDVLTVTAHPGVAAINEFSIYDRWGDLMFGVNNVDPATETIAWDGTFAGKQLNPAVYSFVMKIELITGREEIMTGDITLLR